METNQTKIPEIRTEVMRKDDERKGAGVGLLAKLGLGGGASAGGAGGLAAGGGLLAGKAGVVALILAGSSVAAGIGLIAFGDGSGNRPAAGSSVFAKAEGAAAPGDSAEAFSDSPAPAVGEVSGSLDNFNKANQGAVQDPYAAKPAEEVKDAAAPAVSTPAELPDNSVAPSEGTRPPAASVARPKMVKGTGFGGSNTSSGGSGASGGGALSARGPMGTSADLSRGAAGSSSALRAGSRTASGARRSSIMSGKGASSQLKAHSSQLRRSIGSGNLMESGHVMDGGGSAGSVGGPGGAISGGGAGAGGRGVDSSPNASLSKNLKEVEPPPAPDKKAENKTRYQKEMMIAMGAMLGAMALLFIAGMLSDKAKAASATPWVAAPLYAQAKSIAMIATALAAVATGIGVYLMTKEGQMMQGGMLAAVGAILTFQAGKAWITGSEAAKEAEAQSMGAAKSMAAETPGLQSGATVSNVASDGTVTFSNGQTAMMTPPASAAPGAGVVNSGYTLGAVTPPPAAAPVAPVPPAGAAVNPVTGGTLPPTTEPVQFIPPNF